MTNRRRLEILLRVYAVMLFGFGVFVLAAERHLYRILDLMRLALPVGPPFVPPPDSYWRFVAVSLVWTLGLMCWWASADIDQGRRLVRLLVFSKLLSGILMVVHFACHHAAAAFFFGGLTDLVMGALAAVYYIRAFPGGLRDLVFPTPGPVL